MSDDSTKTQKLTVLTGEELLAPKSSRPSFMDWSEDEAASERPTDAAIAFIPPSGSYKVKTRAVLTVVSGPTTGRAFTIEPGAVETIIGRGKDAEVRIDDPGVSREHSRVVLTPEGNYAIEDMGSTNGTFLGTRRITREVLHSGDRIHMGPNVSVSFAIIDAQAERVVQQLYESSVRDALTRAYNRRYLVERLASEVAYAKRHKTHLALLVFDLDLFKRVNDTHGHLAGDEVLREVANLMQRLVRAEDVFARFGGEEFVLLVRGIEHENVARFAERIRAAVEHLDIEWEDQVLHVTISLGFASLLELGEAERDQTALLRMADERLYKAKSAGRNRVCGA